MFNQIARQEVFIFVGIFMVLATSIKLLGIYNIDSDLFWFIAGVGLIVEGAISLSKQRKFDNKYKIVLKSEIENLEKKNKR